jgi:hypothetical protein
LPFTNRKTLLSNGRASGVKAVNFPFEKLKIPTKRLFFEMDCKSQPEAAPPASLLKRRTCLETSQPCPPAVFFVEVFSVRHGLSLPRGFP